MPDPADNADKRIEEVREVGITRIRRAAALIPIGKPGECVKCGEYSGRLVTGICAPCRDRALIGYARKG